MGHAVRFLTRTFGKRFIVWTGGGGGGERAVRRERPSDIRRWLVAWQTWRQIRETGGEWIKVCFLQFFPPVFIIHLKYKKLLPTPPSVFFLVLSFFCISYIQLLKWLERWTVKLCTGHCSVGNSGCSPLINPPPTHPPKKPKHTSDYHKRERLDSDPKIASMNSLEAIVADASASMACPSNV